MFKVNNEPTMDYSKLKNVNMKMKRKNIGDKWTVGVSKSCFKGVLTTVQKYIFDLVKNFLVVI